jgi:hypothetical protein
MTIRFTGEAGIDELIHIILRAPDTPATDVTRNELVGLDCCHTDKDLLDLALAATLNGKEAWLWAIVDAGRASPYAWRRARAEVLEGFTFGNTLPVEEAWPVGEIRTRHAELRRGSARFRYREACARHWWRIYWESEDVSEAYAAWELFMHAADRRAWVWMGSHVPDSSDTAPLFLLKSRHAGLNLSKLRRRMEKHEAELNKRFLGVRTPTGVGPW